VRPGDDAHAVRWTASEEPAALETTDGLLEHLMRFGVVAR
jgi:8-oxo-dGTP diphosphatase